MKNRTEQGILPRVFFGATLIFCGLLIVAAIFLAVNHSGNNLSSFSESVAVLANDWELTEDGRPARTVNLPQTVEYGGDSGYTLSRTLPKVGGLLASPALCFYSNYVDIAIYLDDTELYSFPQEAAAFNGATGNTYHFVRLPSDYMGRTLTVKVRGQLGDDITYLIKSPLLGSKATILKREVMRSLPAFTLAGCLAILALALGALYLLFRQRLDLNQATLYTALFTLLFAAYIYLETSFAQLLMPNGYLLCYTTLTLLALVPLPLLGLFLDGVSRRCRPLMYGLMLLCALNLLVQTILNFSGVMSVRAMLPATHAVMVLSIVVAAGCLFFSDKKEKPQARLSLLSALPMIAGGLADIILLALEKPSFNNSFWFTLGVVIFIAYQLGTFVNRYFRLYRASLQDSLLADMAYQDTLAGIANRNAYERRLKELGSGEPPASLCCIVMDINDLKLINDTLGHQAGDTAIAGVGALLRQYMPADAAYFRTGGDEFVALLEIEEVRARALAEELSEAARHCGQQHQIPITLAVGSGCYEEADGNIVDFIRRVDTLMYDCKRKQKAEAPPPA